MLGRGHAAADGCSGSFWLEEEKKGWRLGSASVNGDRNRRTRWTPRSSGADLDRGSHGGGRKVTRRWAEGHAAALLREQRRRLGCGGKKTEEKGSTAGCGWLRQDGKKNRGGGRGAEKKRGRKRRKKRERKREGRKEMVVVVG